MHINIDLNCLFDGSLGYNLKDKDVFKKNIEKCIDAAKKINLEIYNKSNEIINSFSFNYQKKIKEQKKFIKIKNKKLVIGLGGSSAGAKAISSYLDREIFFFDNYDPKFINNFFNNNNLNDFTIFVISKSGSTYETLSILNLTYQHLLKISNPISISENLVIVTENKESFLCNFSKEKKITLVDHNKNIGGRFSVFSEPGMLLFDFDPSTVSTASDPAMKMISNLNVDDHNSPILNAACVLSLSQIMNLKFNTNLLYDYALKNYSYWFHQLFAESLGKNSNALTPTTSICPKDHHSMMQLYLDGPKDKLFNIYSPSDASYFEKFISLNLGNIENKLPDQLLNAQYFAIVKTFKEKKIPFRLFNNNDKKNKTFYILELLVFNIFETIILGYAQNINPYDQPAVEQIKLNTFNS